MHRQLDRYAYGPPQVRFTESEVDQARAAGVLIEFERGRPIIVDRSVYRELVKAAITRTHDELQAKAAAAAQEKKAARSSAAPSDPLTDAKRERDTQLRELTDQAHGANLDLGAALINSLAVVDPGDIEVARFFVLCGRPHRTNYADFATMPMRCAAAARGRRSVVESAGGASCSWRRAGASPRAGRDPHSCSRRDPRPVRLVTACVPGGVAWRRRARWLLGDRRRRSCTRRRAAAARPWQQ